MRKTLICAAIVIIGMIAAHQNTGATYKNEYRATAYCACSKCCGQWADGITASGTVAKANKTIAVDKSVIPLGSTVLIYEGHKLLGIYIAEDTGGGIKGNRIDIYFKSHQKALEFGIKDIRIEIVDAVG